MTMYQPMKMAAAEALYHTAQPRVVLAVHHRHAEWPRPVFEIPCPGCCHSWPPAASPARSRASTTFSAPYTQKYGPGCYTPVIPVTYWSFRLMIGVGLLTALIAASVLWLRGPARQPGRRWFAGCCCGR